MQAIITKYISATNVKGSRVKAISQAGSVTLHWDDSLNPDGNHRKAAQCLIAKLGWDYGEWIEGQLPDGRSAWVCDARGVRFRFNDPIATPRTPQTPS